MHPNETTLNDYVDGSLGAAERSGVDQHLAGCAECRQLVERELFGRCLR
jgi:anti-sigma factor RsiW